MAHVVVATTVRLWGSPVLWACVAVVGLSLPGAARGEDECYTRCAVLGTDAVTMTQWEACMQRCHGGGTSAPIPPYAAIAISDNLHPGASHGQRSDSEAEQTAIQHCQGNAGTNCKLVARATQGCVGLAVSNREHVYGWGQDSSRTGAGETALTQCRAARGTDCILLTAPCGGDDHRWSSPLPLPHPKPGQVRLADPRTVGTWVFPINPGRWVWQVGPDGTYQFHSEAADAAPSHSGSFTASNGRWSLQAGNGWTDQGTYSFADANTWVVTGKLGTGTWRRLK